MAVKRRAMSNDGIGVDHIVPLNDVVRTSMSISEDDSEDFADDLSTLPGVVPTTQSLHSFQSSDDGSRSRSLPLWSHSSANSLRSALHMELQEQTEFTPLGNTLVFTARKRKNPLHIALAVFALFGLTLFSKSHTKASSAQEQVKNITNQKRKVHIHLTSVEKTIHELQRQLSALAEERGEYDNNIENTEDLEVANEMKILQDQLRENDSLLELLKQQVQEMSREDAIQKYGAGVIRVQLELEFLDSPEGPNSLVLEMAPLELMPHSVYMFLEMVNARLYDGCSFILNAMHVIKAAPLPYDGSSANAKVKSFTRKGLESVSFREYSPAYPHEKYTVGFAADGSPSFYFNTQDNTDIHEGDPCFAKIISGIDTVKRLEAAPTRNGIWYKQRIGLKRASIL